MHWMESSIYFSAAPMVCWFLPLWMFRGVCLGLLVFPLEDHWGVGSTEWEGYIAHYIHHTKFNWNYGFTTMWDHLMGTNYKGVLQDRRGRAAKEQANVVNCSIGEGFAEVTAQKEDKIFTVTLQGC